MSLQDSDCKEVQQALSEFFEEIKISLASDIEKKSKFYEFEFLDDTPSKSSKRFAWNETYN